MRLYGFDLYKATLEFQNIHSLSFEDQKKIQHDKKWSIVGHHFKNNDFYHDLNNKHLPSNWEDLPIMQKKHYQINFNSLLSKGYNKKNTFIANTSGSSGHPFFYAKNKKAHAMTWTITSNRYLWYNINLNSKQARFYGIPLENTGRVKEKIKDWITNRSRFPIYDLSDNALEKFIPKFQKSSFNYIYGYTNSLVLFARFLNKNNIILKNICPTIKLCIVTSETCTKEDKKILENGFGVKIINEYGVSEAGGITAFEDNEMNWILSTETQYIEIVNEEGKQLDIGQEGNILITDLYNKAMPFIRYNVGDIGKLKFANGRVVLDKLLGRMNDNIVLPDGTISPGLTFYYISRSILESSGVLNEFIIRQTKIDTFIFDIVSERPLLKSEISQIKQKMDIYLQPNLNLLINNVTHIKRPKSGKLKHFYSELDD